MRNIQQLRLATLAFAIVGVLAATASAQAPFIRGDVDGDGVVNGVGDALALYSGLYVSPAAFDCLDAADVNDDGLVGAPDLISLINAAFVLVPAILEMPYPNCGVDPTPDALDCASYSACGGPTLSADPDATLRVASAAGDLGGTVTVAVTLENFQAVHGLSFGVCHDAALVTIETIALGAALVPINPDTYLNIYESEAGGWSASVLFGFSGVITLPSGLEHELYTVTYSLLAAGVSELEFCSGLGNPALTIHNSVTFTGPETVLPVTENGTLTIGMLTGFARGDTDGDSGIGSDDVWNWLNSYLGLGGALLACDGEVELDSGDVNDNEYLTVADVMMLRNFLLGGGPLIPAPDVCGADPNDDTHGFEFVDGDYLLSAFGVTVTGDAMALNPADHRQVSIELRVRSPLPVRGVQFSFTLPAQLYLASPSFTPDAGISGVVDLGATTDGNLVHMAVFGTGPLVPGGGAFQVLGTINLRLQPFGVFPPIQWVPEAIVNGFLRRASVVDDGFIDHHPFLISGSFEFARGNANNLDAAVDLGDAIYTLGHLFNGYDEPECLDAADVNNDGKIDIADPIAELFFLFGGGPPIPAPYPQCGYDLDFDLLDCNDAICP